MWGFLTRLQQKIFSSSWSIHNVIFTLVYRHYCFQLILFSPPTSSYLPFYFLHLVQPLTAEMEKGRKLFFSQIQKALMTHSLKIPRNERLDSHKHNEFLMIYCLQNTQKKKNLRVGQTGSHFRSEKAFNKSKPRFRQKLQREIQSFATGLMKRQHTKHWDLLWRENAWFLCQNWPRNYIFPRSQNNGINLCR